MKPRSIAVIGGGPAGSLVAAKLAQSGYRVLLFDEKLAWEKPCGGGLTHKAITRYPFLREAHVERNWISRCEITSPSGRRVEFQLDQPIAIFSRRVLNGLLLNMAVQAGAELRQLRITSIEGSLGHWRLHNPDREIQAEYLILATGARNPFRAQFSRAFTADDLMATAGYFIPSTRDSIELQFLPGLHGYIWIFPRTNHLSAGICGKLGALSTTRLRELLEQSLRKAGLAFAGTEFYAHILPALSLNTLRRAPVTGPGWAMIGDAAGFTDPITGEGLYYALRSADLLSDALLQEHPESYSIRLDTDFLPELEVAARVADRFFTGRWMGEAVTDRMVQFTHHSPKFRDLMCDMFSGAQGYMGLRQRLYCALPAMVAESAISALGLRGERRCRPGIPKAF